MKNNLEIKILDRIANALERMSPSKDNDINLNSADGFVFNAKNLSLKPVKKINKIPLSLLKGLENQKKILLEKILSTYQIY